MPCYHIEIEKTATVKVLYELKCPKGHNLDMNEISPDTVYSEGQFLEFIEADDWGHPNDSKITNFYEDQNEHSDEDLVHGI